MYMYSASSLERGREYFRSLRKKDSFKLYRYMSVEEFVKMSQGVEMIPYNYDHDAHTDSKGFCFLADTTFGLENEYGEFSRYNPCECLVFLCCESQEILVEFELKSKSHLASKLYQGYGKYTGDSFHDMYVSEYSLPYYNKNELIPRRYMINPSSASQMEDFEEFTNEKQYDIRELKNRILSQNKRAEMYKKSAVSYLPNVPNTDEKNTWSIVEERAWGKIMEMNLTYGNQVTNDYLYELCYQPSSKSISWHTPWGTQVPEPWKKLKEFCDKNEKMMEYPERIFKLAAISATFPKFLDTFDLDIKDITRVFNNQLILSSKNPTQSVQFRFSDISFEMEDGEFVLRAEDDAGNNLNLLDIMENNVKHEQKNGLNDLLTSSEVCTTDLHMATNYVRDSLKPQEKEGDIHEKKDEI